MSIVDEEPTGTISTEALTADEAATPYAPEEEAITGTEAPGEDEEPEPPIGRPLGVAALSAGAAALMTGGIFGVWSARLLALIGACFGVGWAFLVLRRKTGRVTMQLLLLPAAIAVAIGTVAIDSNGESPLSLIGDAIRAGKVLRPPVPFDPGWRPILFLLFVIVGFSAAWVGTALRRPQFALMLPLPILALTAISQPSEGEVIAGFLGLVPLVIAATLLFGGDAASASQLGRDFEVKRMLRSLAFGVPLMLVLVFAAQSNILFPKPAYNPAQKPQKPKAIPLSEAQDRVLFEVAAPDGGDPPIGGPWVIGALDVYDGTEWRLPPYDPKRLKPVPADGNVNPKSAADVTVKFTVRDLGDSSTFPGVSNPAKVDFTGVAAAVAYDPQTMTFRTKSGRLPVGATYSMSQARYPTGDQLKAANPILPKEIKPFLEIPEPPEGIAKMLASAPENPWLKYSFVRDKLESVVIAAGAGVPGAVPPSKVEDLMTGSHKGSPFQIVAAEAMLARWSGLPARIGFGFDAPQKEENVWTIRPRNAAQFVEVYLNDYGWVPIISPPPKAQTSLDTKKDQLFNSTIQPGDDVAVELYIPIELESLKQLYQRIRFFLLQILPYALGLLAIYLGLPWLQKQRRRDKRRKWAQHRGPAAQIAVEYAEFRDAATDLSVGDPFDTPLEYLERVVEDDDHAELAWLVSRVLYGDMRRTADDVDVVTARELAESLRKRLSRAQPFQNRALAVITRASLALPYTTEIPNVRLLKLRRPTRPASGKPTKRKKKHIVRRPKGLTVQRLRVKRVRQKVKTGGKS